MTKCVRKLSSVRLFKNLTKRFYRRKFHFSKKIAKEICDYENSFTAWIVVDSEGNPINLFDVQKEISEELYFAAVAVGPKYHSVSKKGINKKSIVAAYVGREYHSPFKNLYIDLKEHDLCVYNLSDTERRALRDESFTKFRNFSINTNDKEAIFGLVSYVHRVMILTEEGSKWFDEYEDDQIEDISLNVKFIETKKIHGFWKDSKKHSDSYITTILRQHGLMEPYKKIVEKIIDGAQQDTIITAPRIMPDNLGDVYIKRMEIDLKTFDSQLLKNGMKTSMSPVKIPAKTSHSVVAFPLPCYKLVATDIGLTMSEHVEGTWCKKEDVFKFLTINKLTVNKE